jgi:hypothetical protein
MQVADGGISAYPGSAVITREMVLVGAVRVLGSLPVLRWPFAGALLAIAVDLSDLVFLNLMAPGALGDYQHWDKALDAVYMVTFLIAAWRHFGRRERRVSAALFAYRLLGVAAYLALGWRALLLVFPNVFEYWFVFVAGRDRLAPAYALTPARTGAWLAVLTGLKLVQEYVLHVWRILDQYNLMDVLRAIWPR